MTEKGNNMTTVIQAVTLANGQTGILTLYPILSDAIKQGWESLYFPGNDELFAKVETDTLVVELVTGGDVRITDVETDQYLRNKDEAAIRQILDAGRLEECRVDNGNWFSIQAADLKSCEGYTDDLVFEATPKTVEEFIPVFLAYANWYLKEVA
jgi:hypothetical protein